MATEVKVPALGESITSGILVSWLVKDGDYVHKGDLLYELETDKITSEAPAEVAGTISLKANKDDEVDIGQVVALIDETANAPAPVDTPSASSEEPSFQQENPAAAAESVEASPSNSMPLSPAVRKLVEEHRLDPSTITGTGKGGRLVKADVEAAIEKGSAAEEEPSSSVDSPPEPTSDTPVAPSSRTSRKKLSPIRRKIAQRLVAAQQQAALLTTFNEVDLSEIIALRKKHQEAFVEKHGIKLGFMSFFVKAVVHGLQTVPEVNAQLDGDELIQNHYYDIGVAVGTDRGLVVPVLRDCEQASFVEIEQQIVAYAQKARDGKIGIDDLQGGVFTISNGGIYGSMLSTPIVNPPQSGILGMHAIQERPIARNGEVLVRPMMYLALSYDHRIIDGKEAVTFLKATKEQLEDPSRMLLSI
jgi:2-oxoglutarate dehydrogenase E2 component (dihydrolipoamide succinyltransferase)